MSVVKNSARMACRVYARFNLGSFDAAKHPSVDKVKAALKSSLEGTSSGDEAVWKMRVENRRKHLLELQDKLVRTDYGAGMDLQRQKDPSRSTDEVETTVGQVCKSVCKSSFWSSFLFNLVRNFQSHQLIEMGAAVGISGGYLGSAQRLNGEGRTFTLEGDPSLARYAQESFNVLGLDNVTLVQGRFADTLSGVLDNLSAPLDFAFIDGHHDGDATIAYFEQLKPFLTQDAVVVFDDIYWSDSMRFAWELLKKNETFRLSVDLQSVGVCVLGPKDVEKFHVAIPMKYA